MFKSIQIECGIHSKVARKTSLIGISSLRKNWVIKVFTIDFCTCFVFWCYCSKERDCHFISILQHSAFTLAPYLMGFIWRFTQVESYAKWLLLRGLLTQAAELSREINVTTLFRSFPYLSIHKYILMRI